MLTNVGLVNHVKMALTNKWGYVWGTFGQVLTEQLLTEKKLQYPNGVGLYVDFIRTHWLNKRTADCVGLIKSYIWWNGSTAVYNPVTDVSANGMFEQATEKGSMSSFPVYDIPGLCLWKEGHIGVYIGNGQVIEARSTTMGVIQSPLKGEGSSAWTHWLKCPFIQYDNTTLYRGTLDIDGVKTLQTYLNKIGYQLVVDGDYGPATEKAIINFQENNEIRVDGIAGPITQQKIIDMMNKIESPKKITYVDIIKEVSNGSAEAWIKGIDTAVFAAEANGDLGALEIFRHLPTLIENIHKKYSKKQKIW